MGADGIVSVDAVVGKTTMKTWWNENGLRFGFLFDVALAFTLWLI